MHLRKFPNEPCLRKERSRVSIRTKYLLFHRVSMTPSVIKHAPIHASQEALRNHNCILKLQSTSLSSFLFPCQLPLCCVFFTVSSFVFPPFSWLFFTLIIILPHHCTKSYYIKKIKTYVLRCVIINI